MAPKAAPPEKLMYTGELIFFGGPRLSVPVRDREGSRSERGSGSREGQERAALNLPRESRFKRDVASNQVPERASNKNIGTSAGAGSGAGKMKEKCGGRKRRKAIGSITVVHNAGL